MADIKRILLVENDPDISDFIIRQALEPMNYEVKVVCDANDAILQAVKFSPDLILSRLNLPGLSGKDLLVALDAQSIRVPVIIIAGKGEENNVIQAFRLGASDLLFWPASETEIVAVVERTFQQIHERRELDNQLKATNRELEIRLLELTTVFSLGKEMISLTDQQQLSEKIIKSAFLVSGVDFSWLMLLDEGSKRFVLAAHKNLPREWVTEIGRETGDEIHSLAALSGETLSVNGESIQRFKVSKLGKTAMVVPLKIKQEVIGLLVAMRKNDQPFDKHMKTLLEAVADFASIAMTNVRHIHFLKQNAESALALRQKEHEILQALLLEIRKLVQPLASPIDLMLNDQMGKLDTNQRGILVATQAALRHVLQILSVKPPS